MKMGTFGRFQKHQVWEMTQDINQFWGLSFGKELKKKMKIQIRSLSQIYKLSQLISLRGLKEDLLFDKLDEVR